MPSDTSPARRPPWSTLVAATAAAALPALLAYNVSPSPTFLNQALAVALWGVFVVVSRPVGPGSFGWPLFAALALLTASAVGSMLFGRLPSSLAWSAVATLAAAAVVGLGGAGAARRPDGERVFAAFACGFFVCGLLNVGVALLQVFAPDLPDGDWIARSSYEGRAVGNLRQPNHLSSLLLWGCIAAVALLESKRLLFRWAAPAFVAMVFAVVLTASRTGLVSVAVLALWGLFDRRLSRPARGLLLAAPLVYALSWSAMAWWASASAHAFGGAARMAETDISSSRFAIWSNTLALIRAHPWGGVGFGEFNVAWSLTPFPGRPTAFFDHTHNLPLQLAVELGLPLAALVLGLLLWALLRAGRLAFRPPNRPSPTATGGDATAAASPSPSATGLDTARRCACLMVAMIGLHSLLEYPLWYAYFLLPTAWAWGFALGGAEASRLSIAPPSRVEPSAAWVVAGGALVIGSALSVLDYGRVVAIFGDDESTEPLAQRIEQGRRSVFFSHHADYAVVTSGIATDGASRDFDRVTHYLLDTRLMTAWARALAREGRVDEARHIAQRLREFRRSDGDDLFAGCPGAPPPAADAAPPDPADAFACQPPERAHGWRALQSPR